MKLTTLAVALCAALVSPSAMAAEHVVNMLNAGPGGERMAFDPAFIAVQPGDVIVFKPVDKGHAVASEIVPAGSSGWDGALNEETRVTVDRPGVYLYRSKPHFALGMIGMIVAGSADANRTAIEGFRPRGSLMKARYDALAAQLGQ